MRAAVLLGAALASVLAALALPGPGLYDAGELSAAAITLGVPHPTGFPLFNLAGHAFALLPVGAGAFRVNLLGGLCSAAAAVLLLRGLLPLLDPIGGAWRLVAMVFGALTILAAPAVLLHARSAEVYPLGLLLVAFGIDALVRADESDARPWLCAALALGLGAVLHVEVALVLCAATLPRLGALGRLVRARGCTRMLGLGAACLGLPLLGLCYLPLASGGDSAWQWADLRSIDALVGHLTGRSIRDAFAGEIGGDARHLEAAVRAWRDLLLGGLGPALGLSALGLVALGRRQARAGAVLAAALLAETGYGLFVNPMGLRELQTGLVALLLLGALAGAGLLALASLLASVASARVALVTGALALVLPVQQILASIHGDPPSDDRLAARFGEAFVDEIPVGGVGLSASDHAASLCAWLQAAEGARPDAWCVPTVLLGSPGTLERARHHHGSALVSDEAMRRAIEPGPRLVRALLRTELAGPGACWELGNSAYDAGSAGQLWPGFPAFRLRAQGPAPAELPGALRRRSQAIEGWIGRDPASAAWPARLHYAQIQRLAASWLVLRGLPHLATEHLARALAAAPNDPRTLNNLAVVSEVTQGAVVASRYADRAVEADPTYGPAARTSARLALRLRDFAALRTHLTEAAARTGAGDPKARQAFARWLQGLAGDAANARDREIAQDALRAAATLCGAPP